MVVPHRSAATGKILLFGGIAMVVAGDFKNGITFDMDGNVYQVIEFQHVKPGKGAAFVRTKMKNVVTGAVTETSGDNLLPHGQV